MWDLGWSDLHGHEVTVHTTTTGEPDDSGVPSRTTEDRVLDQRNVQPVGTSESVGSEQLVTGRYRVSGPLAEWVSAGDEVTWNGARYQVEGEPQHFTGGAIDHTEFVLVGWKGA